MIQPHQSDAIKAGGVSVRRTVERFRRIAFLERSAIRALAGWFLVARSYEAKIAMGHHLWSHAERADALRQRLKELRGGHRDANLEPAMRMLGDRLGDAENEAAFLSGMKWLLTQLDAAYRDYLDASDPSANAMERRLIRRFDAELRDQLDWHERTEPDRAWNGYLDALLEHAGGIDGEHPRRGVQPPPPATRFARPTEIQFDQRITGAPIPGPEAREAQPFDEHRVSEFRVFFNEFYASALLASILFDAWGSDLPWAFFHDLCHHFWDEVRHSEFGWRRLKELDVEPDRVDQSLFTATQDTPILHRLCYLTLGLEVYFMPRKAPRVRKYEEAGDPRSQLFADYDWSDEGNHVRYGKKWVDHLMADDARTVDEVRDEIMAHLKRKGVELPDGQLAPF